VIIVSIGLLESGVESVKNDTEDCHELNTYKSENAKKDYSGYQVLKIPHGLDRISIAFLSKRVDFWTSPYQNGSDINFLVSPEYGRDVKKYLKSKNIPAKILIKNFQSEIEREDSENELNIIGKKDPEVHHFMKRSTIWDELFDFVMTATGSRNPRKVQNSVSDKINVLPIQNQILPRDPRGTRFSPYSSLFLLFHFISRVICSFCISLCTVLL